MKEENNEIWVFLSHSHKDYEKVSFLRNLLEKEGYHIRLTPVLAVEVTDEVGNLNKLLKALDESNINVDYLYLSFNRETGRPIMVFHAEGPYEVESCLVGKGFIMTENL